MIEYIPDLREVDLVPGLDVSWRISADPIPGFQDLAGNFVGVGDWVATGACTSYHNQLRLAQVLSVEPKAVSVHDHWADVPEDKWTAWHHEFMKRYAASPDWRPQESVTREAIKPLILVRQYFSLSPDSWARRQVKDAESMVRYAGEVPYLR